MMMLSRDQALHCVPPASSFSAVGSVHPCLLLGVDTINNQNYLYHIQVSRIDFLLVNKTLYFAKVYNVNIHPGLSSLYLTVTVTRPIITHYAFCDTNLGQYSTLRATSSGALA
jgi:hypothetical protein